MKRADKITLLTQVLTSPSAHEARRRLEQAITSEPRTLILIDDFGDDEPASLTSTDQVTFYDKGQEHQLPLSEAGRYARRHGIRVLSVEPINTTTQS